MSAAIRSFCSFVSELRKCDLHAPMCVQHGEYRLAIGDRSILGRTQKPKQFGFMQQPLPTVWFSKAATIMVGMINSVWRTTKPCDVFLKRRVVVALFLKVSPKRLIRLIKRNSFTLGTKLYPSLSGLFLQAVEPIILRPLSSYHPRQSSK
jgi:hypothetical protein